MSLSNTELRDRLIDDFYARSIDPLWNRGGTAADLDAVLDTISAAAAFVVMERDRRVLAEAAQWRAA